MKNEKLKQPTYKIELDSENYWTGNYCTVGRLPNQVEIEKLPEETDRNKIKSYKYDFDNNTLVFDEERYKSSLLCINKEKSNQEKIFEIDKLKAELSSTDYKVIKCAECSISGEEMPYDAEELHNERQSLRDKINELEEQLM